MRLLVTGGSGFIGSNFIRHWMAEHPEDAVVNLDKLTYAANPKTLDDIKSNPFYAFLKADIADPDAVEAAFEQHDPDVVVHFAAESHVDRSLVDAGAFVRTNVVGTHVLLEAARKHEVKRFHHVSTDEVFGALSPQDTSKFDEDTPYAPRNPYSATKAAADHLARAYFETFEMPITISNCANNFGPFHTPEKMIPLAITNLLSDSKIPVYGEGRQVRDWLHVADHCRGIAAIIEKGEPGQTYCMGGEHDEIANLEVARRICSLLDRNPDDWIEFVPDRLGHDFKYAVCSDKIGRELGWSPEFGFESGLAATVEWYKENENWWQPMKDRRPGKRQTTG